MKDDRSWKAFANQVRYVRGSIATRDITQGKLAQTAPIRGNWR
jgi:hypothetical protein